MEVFVAILILFSIGAMIGWVIEVFWRRFFSNPKVWKNPGFLHGPWLPLYGFGTVLLYAISSLEVNLVVKIILFCFVMTLIEYIAGIIFIKGMKIKLWDYSKCWGNIQGIICPLYSFLWTVLGVLFYFLVFPTLDGVVHYILDHYYTYLLIGLFYGVFFCDFFATIDFATKLAKFKKEVIDTKLDAIEARKEAISFEELKVSVRNKMHEKGRRYNFFIPFNDDFSLSESIREQFEKLKDKIEDTFDDIVSPDSEDDKKEETTNG